MEIAGRPVLKVVSPIGVHSFYQRSRGDREAHGHLYLWRQGRQGRQFATVGEAVRGKLSGRESSPSPLRRWMGRAWWAVGKPLALTVTGDNENVCAGPRDNGAAGDGGGCFARPYCS